MTAQELAQDPSVKDALARMMPSLEMSVSKRSEPKNLVDYIHAKAERGKTHHRRGDPTTPALPVDPGSPFLPCHICGYQWLPPEFHQCTDRQHVLRCRARCGFSVKCKPDLSNTQKVDRWNSATLFYNKLTAKRAK
jgi:hypothetical protein